MSERVKQLGLVVGLFLLAGDVVGLAAHADTRSFRVDFVREIVGPEGQSRALVVFADLRPIEGVVLSQAVLKWPVPSSVDVGRALPLSACAIARPWSESVTWTDPWSSAGGDRHKESCAITVVPPGPVAAGELQLDVTPVIRECLEGSIPNYGLVLSRESEEGGGFSPEETEILHNLSESRLVLSYRAASRPRI
jgi:hypothetical protein